MIYKKIHVDENILFMAFRYGLGRSTYVVKEVCEELIENWNLLNVETKKLIHKEINQSINEDKIGHQIDKFEWLKILNLKI